MSFHSVRLELHRLGNKNLFRVLMSQKESDCLLRGLCSFRFKYKGYTFCLSEVLGRGCDIQNLEKLEKEICGSEEEHFSQESAEIPLFERRKEASSPFAKRKRT